MIYPIRTIVAGIAELEKPDPVLLAAVELAERTGASLHLVHAFELPDLMWDAYARMGYADGELLKQYMDGVQHRLEAHVRERTESPKVHCHAIAGPGAAMIREVATKEAADLVLVGATRRGTLARTILGTTAQRVLRISPAPVLVLRGELPVRLRRVLLGTDLSPFSAGIHEIGLDVLESLFAGERPELRSVFALEYASELPAPLSGELLERTAREELEQFLRERRDRDRVVGGVVRMGDAAREILAESVDWAADVLVVGTHGRSGPGRWLLGSVAEAAVRGAEVSVLVIPSVLEEQRTLPVPVERSMEVAAPEA